MSRLMLSAERFWPTRSCSSPAMRRRSASSTCTRRRLGEQRALLDQRLLRALALGDVGGDAADAGDAAAGVEHRKFHDHVDALAFGGHHGLLKLDDAALGQHFVIARREEPRLLPGKN